MLCRVVRFVVVVVGFSVFFGCKTAFRLDVSCITSTLVCVAFYIGIRNLKQPESLKFGSLTL